MPASDGRVAESNPVAFEVAGSLSAMSDEGESESVEEPTVVPETSEVSEPMAVPEVAPAALMIITQPEDCHDVDGDGWARFKVEAEGEGLAYRWEWTNDEGKTWAELPLPDDAEALKALGFVIEGADAAELKVKVEGLPEEIRFRCVVVDSASSKLETSLVAYTPMEA